MKPSAQLIARALLCMALLFGVTSLIHAAADPLADAKTGLADAIAKTIADKITADPATLKDDKAIEKTIKSELAASEFGAVASIAQRVHSQVWTLIAADYGKAVVKDKLEAKPVAAGTGAVAGAGAVAEAPAAAATQGASTSDSQVLKTFDTTYGSKAVLTTAHIFSGYFSLTGGDASGGLNITASLPAGASSLRDYANNEMLLRDGGFLNVYFSFAPPKPTEVKQGSDDRRFALNRFYRGGQTALAKTDERRNIYFTHGLGMKVVKTTLATDNLALAGVGSLFLGVGADGNLYQPGSDANAGTMTIELTATGNATSKHVMKSLYGASNPTLDPQTTFATWGGTARFYVKDEIFISVGYYKPLDRRTRDLIHEVTSFNIGYNLGAAKTPAKTGPGASGSGQ